MNADPALPPASPLGPAPAAAEPVVPGYRITPARPGFRIAAGLACLFTLACLGHALPGASGGAPSAAAPDPAVHIAADNAAPPTPGPRMPPAPARAEFHGAPAAADVRLLADWIAASGDARGRPYAIVDKRHARAYLFDGQSRLSADSAVLLGAARGDDSVPGIGERPIAKVRPHERTTPAGRFSAEPGRNAGGEDIIWVDYDAAVSMHRVRANNSAERRLQRLVSPGTEDNRISYGCINVPAAFYDAHVKPLLTQPGAMIYVLPETRGLADVFGAGPLALRPGAPGPAIAQARHAPSAKPAAPARPAL